MASITIDTVVVLDEVEYDVVDVDVELDYNISKPYKGRTDRYGQRIEPDEPGEIELIVYNITDLHVFEMDDASNIEVRDEVILARIKDAIYKDLNGGLYDDEVEEAIWKEADDTGDYEED